MRNEIPPREAAILLGYSLNYVYSLIWTGVLKARQLDGRWLVDGQSVSDRLKDREVLGSTDNRAMVLASA